MARFQKQMGLYLLYDDGSPVYIYDFRSRSFQIQVQIILQMWGGVIVWNPKGCLRDRESKQHHRHMISYPVRC